MRRLLLQASLCLALGCHAGKLAAQDADAGAAAERGSRGAPPSAADGQAQQAPPLPAAAPVVVEPPVLEGDALVGIVSIGDVVKSTITELQYERDRLQEYVSS